jgi:serine phosphatase RsbU (regulator of sigma subunit)
VGDRDGRIEEALRDPERLASLRRLGVFDAGPRDAFDRRTRLVARMLDAPYSLVAFIDAERQYVKSTFGLPEQVAAHGDLPLEWGYCVQAIVEDGAVQSNDVTEDESLPPNPADELGIRSFVSVPLRDEHDNALGVICALDTRPRTWTHDHVDLLVAFADSLMAQLELQWELERNQRLVELSTRAATRERHRAQQLLGLAETSLLLTSGMPLDQLLQVVTDQARELVGAHLAASRVVTNHGSAASTTRVSTSEKYEAVAGDLFSESIWTLDELSGPLRFTEREFDAYRPWQEVVSGSEPTPPLRGLLAAPFVAGDGRPLGLIQLSDKYEGDFSEEDQAILLQVARIASVAIESRQAYEREHEIAMTLQESFLPRGLPEVAGLDLAAEYLPSTIGMAVGGDWYDAIPISDTSVGLVVGDVVGHGVRAAAIMGQLRNTLRAFLLDGLRPSRVLERLDRMAENFGAGDFATVVLIELEPNTGFIRWSSAGQLPPLVTGPDGEPRFLEGPVSPPVGSGLPGVHTESTALLAPGSTLVLYTDGLVEKRTEALDRGLERLRATVRSALSGSEGACADAQGVVDFVSERLVGIDREDDVALLVACMLPRPPRRPPGEPTPSSVAR